MYLAVLLKPMGKVAILFVCLFYMALFSRNTKWLTSLKGIQYPRGTITQNSNTAQRAHAPPSLHTKI